MLGIYILLTFFSFTIDRGEGSKDLLKLGIYNSNGQFLNKSYIVKNVDDTLILLCKTKLDYNKKTKLTWILPSNNKNRPYNTNRVHKIEVNGSSLRLTVEHLQESDNGQYQCVDKGGNKDHPTAVVNLIIRSPPHCGKGVFCGNYCILERFTCDGLVDCKNGKDESEALCGPNPCQNKIKCPDGRCIPQSWCCNGSLSDCMNKWDVMCCLKSETNLHNYNVVPSLYNDPNNRESIRPFREYGDHPISYINNPHQYTDLNFLQTTIYAVFGCAILFMLIVTILVVIMQCKLQMRRNWQFQLLNRQRNCGGNSTYHRALNQEDIMDIMADRRNQGNLNSRSHPQSTPGGLLVTYNINNGVHIVGKPIEPPPYTAVAPNPPLNQGPPPPYLSSSEEDENASSSNGKKKRKGKRRLSKVQASSEPNLSNIS